MLRIILPSSLLICTPSSLFMLLLPRQIHAGPSTAPVTAYQVDDAGLTLALRPAAPPNIPVRMYVAMMLRFGSQDKAWRGGADTDGESSGSVWRPSILW